VCVCVYVSIPEAASLPPCLTD